MERDLTRYRLCRLKAVQLLVRCSMAHSLCIAPTLHTLAFVRGFQNFLKFSDSDTCSQCTYNLMFCRMPPLRVYSNMT